MEEAETGSVLPLGRKRLLIRALKGGGSTPLSHIPRKYAIYCALMLTFLSILDQADKWAVPTLQIAGLQCLSCGGADQDYTQKCLEQCLDLSDSQIGFLTGPAFSITAVFAGLPFGYIADRTKRVRVLLVGIVIWSLATFFSAFVNGFYELAILRMALGIGTAALSPTGYSLLSDFFPLSIRGVVMSIFQTSIYLGQDIGLLMGIVSQYTSWRLVFLILGLPGLVMAIPFYLTVWEPQRGLQESKESSPSEANSNTGNVKSLFDVNVDYSGFSLFQKN